MEESLTDKVRSSCQAVAEQATHVQVNYDYIQPYTSLLPLDQAVSPELDADTHYLCFDDNTVAYYLILDTINFGSGYFPHLKKRPGRSGYFTIASSLTDYFNSCGPLTADQLSLLSPDDCTRMFGQDPGNEIVQELMQLFSRALNQLGRYLIERFNGSFVDLIKAAEDSVDNLMKLLVQIPFYNDVESYDSMKACFFKRAQMTAADLSIAFKKEGYGYFTDLEKLTIFADNLVPHVLRIDGILLYTDELADRIDAGELLPAMSPEEVEIRACAVHAAELIVQELRRSGNNVTSHGLDYLLWNRGQQPYYKKVKPRHLTRTVFY